MEIKKAEIDKGQAFDFGRTSEIYAQYRDIYPECMFQKDKNLFYTTDFESCLGRAFGVKLFKLDPIVGNGCNKRNMMFLCHWVIERNKELIFAYFNIDFVFVVGLFGYLRWKRNSTAADYRFSCGRNHITAEVLFVQRFKEFCESFFFCFVECAPGS